MEQKKKKKIMMRKGQKDNISGTEGILSDFVQAPFWATFVFC